MGSNDITEPTSDLSKDITKESKGMSSTLSSASDADAVKIDVTNVIQSNDEYCDE